MIIIIIIIYIYGNYFGAHGISSIRFIWFYFRLFLVIIYKFGFVVVVAVIKGCRFRSIVFIYILFYRNITSAIDKSFDGDDDNDSNSFNI